MILPLSVAAISGYSGDKLGLVTFLTRFTFPYLILISLVSLFSGILNSLSRFTAAAFALDPCDELGGRERPAEQKPLHRGAAALAQT